MAENLPEPDDVLLNFDDDPITILVGKQKQKFWVHRHQMTQSTWFAAGLTGQFRQVVTGVFEIDNVTPLLFRRYLHFLYTGRIERAEYQDLARLYVFAGKLLDSRFKNFILDAILDETMVEGEDGFISFPDEKTVEIIYCQTPEHSRGRQLMVDLYYFEGRPSWVTDTYHPNFLRDLLLKFYKGRSKKALEYRPHENRSAYHE